MPFLPCPFEGVSQFNFPWGDFHDTGIRSFGMNVLCEWFITAYICCENNKEKTKHSEVDYAKFLWK